MPKRKIGLTTKEIQKLLIDLEDEIFDDSDSDCELENEEDLDQSINFNVVAEDELISQKQNEIFWENPQIFHKAKILPFTGNIMIRGAAELCETESDFFNCIFKNSIVKKVTDETNIYAARILQNATPSNSRRHNPARTQSNEVEMIKFLALILLMGHIEKDNVKKEYWSTDPMLETPFFRTVMPRDRFLNLLRFLHFEDNNIPDKTALDYDRLWKLRYVFDSLNNSFQNIYNPSEELAIDEGNVQTKRGGVIFKTSLRFEESKEKLSQLSVTRLRSQCV
ncbi:piggyBac transposable element-derived protein 4 [Trichonephila clavipes]|nr:piggyBac transposable element-derived protein 4 [Trichonephila clavipes]